MSPTWAWGLTKKKVWVSERVRASQRKSVCVCVCVFQKVYVLVRERVYVCVRKCMCKSEMERERVRVWVCLWKRETESLCVCCRVSDEIWDEFMACFEAETVILFSWPNHETQISVSSLKKWEMFYNKKFSLKIAYFWNNQNKTRLKWFFILRNFFVFLIDYCNALE